MTEAEYQRCAREARMWGSSLVAMPLYYYRFLIQMCLQRPVTLEEASDFLMRLSGHHTADTFNDLERSTEAWWRHS